MNGLALCSGVGGLELGLSIAIPGYRGVCYVEREAYCAAALVARMEEEALDRAPVWDDLATFDGRPWRGVVDLVSAGFPCQPFSAAGKKLGTDDERWLWPSIERVLGEVRARWVVLENVPGLVRHGLGPVLSGLAALGYDAEWGLLRASDVGAPHRRERFFLLGRMADAERERCDDAPTGGRRGAGAAAGGAGCDMAHPTSRRLGELREPPRSNGQSNGRDEGVADSDHKGRVGEREPTTERQRGRQPHRRSGTQLADTRRELLEGRHDGSAGPAPRRADRAGLPVGRRLFPPGPAALDLWAGVLAETPEVEPSLCRVADGVAEWMEYRTDRLRATGNGVVPLQAAVAIRTLAARAGWELTP